MLPYLTVNIWYQRHLFWNPWSPTPTTTAAAPSRIRRWTTPLPLPQLLRWSLPQWIPTSGSCSWNCRRWRCTSEVRSRAAALAWSSAWRLQSTRRRRGSSRSRWHSRRSSSGSQNSSARSTPSSLKSCSSTSLSSVRIWRRPATRQASSPSRRQRA